MLTNDAGQLNLILSDNRPSEVSHEKHVRMKRIRHFTKEVRGIIGVRAIKSGLTLAALLTVAASLSFAAVGRPRLPKSTNKSYTMTLSSATNLNNDTVLKPGDYVFKFPENTPSPEVEFYTGGKLVVKAQAKVETQPQKNSYTAVELGRKENIDILIAIDPTGLPERLVFNELSGQ